MKTQTIITIRFADRDPMGHTNNAKYFTYMEQTRVELFKKLLQIKDGNLSADFFQFILAEISCRFLKPAFFGQELKVEAKITEVKNSSFIIEYELNNAASGENVAVGKSVQVWYDYKNRKSIPIPDNFRKIMTE